MEEENQVKINFCWKPILQKKIAKIKSGLSAVPNYLVSCMDPASRDILDKQKLEDHLGEITKVNSETVMSNVVIKKRF